MSSARQRNTVVSSTWKTSPGSRGPVESHSAELSVGQQQRVEILRVLHRGADILILDEPTAVLTPQETKEIFAVLRRTGAY